MTRLGVDFERRGFDYFDASDDRSAWRETELAPLLEHDLILAGFKPLGCVRAVMRNGARELVEQVWVGDGGRIMVTAGNGADLATLFEDGSVVKTTTFHGVGVAWRLRRKPKERHDYEQVHGDIDAVRARHLERIASFEAKSAVVLVDTMLPYLATRIRTGELIVAAARRRDRVALVVVAAAMILIPAICTVWLAATHAGPVRAVVLGVLASLIVGIPAMLHSRDWIAPAFDWVWPAFPPRPAKALLEQAAKSSHGGSRSPSTRRS